MENSSSTTTPNLLSSDPTLSSAEASLVEAGEKVVNANGTGPGDGEDGEGGRRIAKGNLKGQERLQIIDEEQRFSSEVDRNMDQWGLLDKGFSYDVVAVFGSQSTGKSTLLNRLFGTTFDVMDESQRRQTTKGIWMCPGQDMDVLVMDVEGTDGRERGEDQDFERKSALFSMASAEVLIVNMWEHQVGLYQGANMSLLKTVFEVNLSLFQTSKGRNGASKDKTLLLFVIRDHVGHTPLSNLSNTITSDLEKIWSGLSKPEGLEDCKISDYFDMMFTTLPHKILLPQEFEKEVLNLRRRFIDRKDPNFVFRPNYHKRIPADGLGHYMEGIWQQVMTNKDLDLPTQQELLAQFRCDEIANGAFAVFANDVKGFRRPVEAGTVIPELGADMEKHRKAALVKFDTAASRYHAEVYRRKRSDLLDKLNSTLSPFFLGQLKNLHKAVLKEFKASILDKLKGEGYDFAQVVKSERQKAEGAFEEAANAILLKDTDWSFDEEFAQLREDITQVADQSRVEETKKMVTQIERNIKKQVAEPTELALNKPSVDMWDKILKAFNDALDKAETTYLKKGTSFNCTEEENQSSLTLLRRRSWLALRSKVDEQTADAVLLIKLRTLFEDKFRYDKDGVPRVWTPDDDIDGAFRTARDATLALIPIYAKIAPTDPNLMISLPSSEGDDTVDEPGFDFDSTLTIFTETKQNEIISRFRKEADAYYVEAKRSTVSSIAQIPYWIYAVLVVLGWNEAIAVLSSPFLFASLCILGASFYVAVQFSLLGPMMTVGKAVFKEVKRLVEQKLREVYSQPPSVLAQPVQPRASPSRSASSSTATDDGNGRREEFEMENRKVVL